MNYYKTPMARRLASNLVANKRHFMKYKFGSAGSVSFVLFDLDLYLRLDRDGRAFCKRLARNEKPDGFGLDLQTFHSLSYLGEKLYRAGLLTSWAAVVVFEASLPDAMAGRVALAA